LKLIDSHCHLEADEFDDCIDSVIDSAMNAGIVKLITSSVVYSQWEKSKSLHEKFNSVEFTIGVHPWYVSDTDYDIKDKLNNADNIGAIAIGEIGLDKKIQSPSFDLQQNIFELQLQYAVDTNKPVIIHCRGAFNELIESINKIGVPKKGGIIHAYSGSAELTEILIKHGLSFSMGGTLTYRNSKKRDNVLKIIYPDYFLLESDSPDIPPVNTVKPNVPSNILLSLKAASEILMTDQETIAKTTTENAKKIFGINI
jgi:TatD DNase family protein